MGPETGFFYEQDLRTSIEETGFFTESVGGNPVFSQKPGFCRGGAPVRAPCASPNENTGFEPLIPVKKPVSLVLMRSGLNL